MRHQSFVWMHPNLVVGAQVRNDMIQVLNPKNPNIHLIRTGYCIFSFLKKPFKPVRSGCPHNWGLEYRSLMGVQEKLKRSLRLSTLPKPFDISTNVDPVRNDPSDSSLRSHFTLETTIYLAIFVSYFSPLANDAGSRGFTWKYLSGCFSLPNISGKTTAKTSITAVLCVNF